MSEKKSDVSGAVVSMDLAINGKTLEIKNLTQKVRVSIKAPLNPYAAKVEVAYMHTVKTMQVVTVSSNKSAVFIEIKNITEVSCFGLPVAFKVLVHLWYITEVSCFGLTMAFKVWFTCGISLR